MPTLPFATSIASGNAARIRSMTGTSSSGPLPQLPPTAAAPASSSAAAACSGVTPIIVWPRVSKLIVAMTGISGAASFAPWIAATPR